VTLLRLGRVSNLPTVWTNVHGRDRARRRRMAERTHRPGASSRWSLFYVGGMYLNDYFDRAIDARERPGPPDPGRRHRRQCGRGLPASRCCAPGIVLLAATGVLAAVMGLDSPRR
jgi:4-hydroxybenzoate polyprenyltransferase